MDLWIYAVKIAIKNRLIQKNNLNLKIWYTNSNLKSNSSKIVYKGKFPRKSLHFKNIFETMIICSIVHNFWKNQYKNKTKKLRLYKKLKKNKKKGRQIINNFWQNWKSLRNYNLKIKITNISNNSNNSSNIHL